MRSCFLFLHHLKDLLTQLGFDQTDLRLGEGSRLGLLSLRLRLRSFRLDESSIDPGSSDSSLVKLLGLDALLLLRTEALHEVVKLGNLRIKSFLLLLLLLLGWLFNNDRLGLELPCPGLSLDHIHHA